jgi:hypothetical protein
MAEGFQELRSFPSLPDRFLHDLGLADNIVRWAFFVTFFLTDTVAKLKSFPRLNRMKKQMR